jgi:hypothetical protein
VKVRQLAFSAAALAALGGAAAAKEPAKAAPKPGRAAIKQVSATAPVDNQQLAESIGSRLTGSAVAQGADVSVVTDNGVVTVSGPCASTTQKQAILDEIRVVPGVKTVRDGLTVGAVQQVQGVGPLALQAPVVPPPGMPGTGLPGLPGLAGPGVTVGGPVVEPAPVGQPGANGMTGAAPPLPPYAWPTYAPHNNVSRVAYPTAYPYNAFPFIGPFYPFPKVPLGWRSVKMEWEDGHWWYGRTSTPQDYWRVRFW